jgi:hypothetical protein
MDVLNFHNMRKGHADVYILYVLLVDDQMNKSSNIYHHVSEWNDVVPTLMINVHQLWRRWDELSSVFLENQSPSEPLLFSLVINGHARNRRTILPGMSLVFDLFLDALPVSALHSTNLLIVLSHMKAQIKVRWQLRNYQYVRLTEQRDYPIFMIANDQEMSRFMAQNGHWKPIVGAGNVAHLPSTFGKALNQKLPELRQFDWVVVPETEPGIYLLPAGYRIFTSLSVFVPQASRLKLRPTFRHSYPLQPGHNCFDLFFQDFYVPAGSRYYLEGRSGLEIWIRAGNPLFVHPPVVTLPAPAHLITKNGWIYQRTKTEVRFLDVVNEKHASQYTCVLALHERIGQDSKLRVYFQLAELHETMLFREIWEFLDDGDDGAI